MIMVLFYGTAVFGKDRVGVMTALLLCVLGVHRDVIREDFMRSNVCLAGELDYMLRYLEANRLDSIANVNKVSALFKVKEEYLDRMFADHLCGIWKCGALFEQRTCI